MPYYLLAYFIYSQVSGRDHCCPWLQWEFITLRNLLGSAYSWHTLFSNTQVTRKFWRGPAAPSDQHGFANLTAQASQEQLYTPKINLKAPCHTLCSPEGEAEGEKFTQASCSGDFLPSLALRVAGKISLTLNLNGADQPYLTHYMQQQFPPVLFRLHIRIPHSHRSCWVNYEGL